MDNSKLKMVTVLKNKLLHKFKNDTVFYLQCFHMRCQMECIYFFRVSSNDSLIWEK